MTDPRLRGADARCGCAYTAMARRPGRPSCALLAVLFWAHLARAHESSDVYLQSVVNELNKVNGMHQDSHVAESVEDRRASYAESNFEMQQPQVVQTSPQLQPQVEAPPAVLGFNPTDLAAMYTRALEQGSPVKYEPFANTLNHQIPNILTVDGRYQPAEGLQPQLEPLPQEPQYAYYFYPIHTFQQELPATRPGYRILPNHQYTLPSKSSKKEMNPMNPILVGITSFMGMALVFFLSLFFYPRFMHFMHFPFFATSRTILQNELTNLTAFVTEAVDYYNKNVRKRTRRLSAVKSAR